MKIVYLGSGDIGVPSLEWLLGAPGVEVAEVVTQPDRAAGRGMNVRYSSIKQLAISRGVEVFQPEKIREASAVSHIAALHPDLLVVMAYGQILPQSLLDVPRLGALNLHASLLPRHRGAAPVHAAILAGETTTGITAMWMDAGLDTGDVLLQQELDIASDETAGSLHDKLAALAPAALQQSLLLIREGRAPRIKQEEPLATYAPKLDRAAGRIDWSRSAVEIARRVRGLHPWPGSSAELIMRSGQTLSVKIHRVAPAEGRAAPGAIVDGLRVGCGGGGLLDVLELQVPGRNVMSASEFTRGREVSAFVAGPPTQQQQAQQQ